MTDSNLAEAPRAAQAAHGDDGLLLEMIGISRSFPGVMALQGVDFDLRAGEVHVLFGENGAGKSTLINIIAGALAPDAGEYKFQGRSLVRLKPHAARMMGISPVFQEFSLVPELIVAENLFLCRELAVGCVLTRSAMRAQPRSAI